MGISKYFSLLASLTVGITFLFSGAVKLNDPLGFAYKIEEYLHVLAGQLTGHLRLLLPYTLGLAILVATLEVVLGTALLVHWQRYWVLRALLLLTLFFTGLTLYTATSSRIASCGCFGDALDLSPWQSFGKSVVLLLLLGGLCWPTTSSPTRLSSYYWVAAALVLSLGLSWYSLHHLPWLDFRPYKVGSNLAQLIQPRLPLRYMYIVEKDGQTIATEDYPQAPGYKFIASRLLNPEDVPAVTNFSVWQGEEDCTQALLTGHKLLLIVQNPASVPAPTLQQLQVLVQQLPQGLQPVLITPDGQGQEIAAALALPLHTAHAMLLRTMLRAPLGLVYLQEGVVAGKWHYQDLARAQKQLGRLVALQ